MKLRLHLIALLLSSLLIALPVHAGDLSPLRPPAGARVALIVFEDLECSACAIASPLLHKAAETYKIPLIQHDFPLPMHSWSFQAAVNAQWFDTQSKKLGDAYRSYIFEHQEEISKDNLRSFTDRFAASHKVVFPLFADPKGALGNKVRQEVAIGHSLNINQTPTVYLVSNTAKGPSVHKFTNSGELSTELYSQIDAALKQSRPAAAPGASHNGGKSSPAKTGDSQ